jgi:SOS-response transcriptional repressor LexA
MCYKYISISIDSDTVIYAIINQNDFGLSNIYNLDMKVDVQVHRMDKIPYISQLAQINFIYFVQKKESRFKLKEFVKQATEHPYIFVLLLGRQLHT